MGGGSPGVLESGAGLSTPCGLLMLLGWSRELDSVLTPGVIINYLHTDGRMLH